MTNVLPGKAATVVTTTIKLSTVTRDRLKSSAVAQGKTLDEYLNFLEDLHARELRWDAMRAALGKMTAKDWAEYRAETESISGADLDGLSDEDW